MKLYYSMLFIVCAQVLSAQHYESNWESLNKRKIPEWFHQDKFGIFIHWGVYSVPAFAPVIPNSGYSYSEWYWYRLVEKQKDFIAFHEKNYGVGFNYAQLEPLFKAELFDPQQWARLFKKSGAKYVVLTSKHHEGYALWPSKEADRDWGRPWNAVSGAPHRDLLGDLTGAVRGEGLKMGYYYSLYEWFNPLWQKDKPAFIKDHLFPQFKDLVTHYKPSIIFSDGEWDLKDSDWKSPELLAWLFNESPVAAEVVVNDRWGSNTREHNTGSTYTTSEYGSGMESNVVWEENQGIGHSYGYNRNESLGDYKSSYELILMLCDIVSRGGNLLLDVGPTGDGRIPVIMQQRLSDIGDWLEKNGACIYGTEAWKRTRQYSAGKLPEKKNANFMAGYRIVNQVKVRQDSAYVECFFTQHGKDLYCILPAYRSSITLKDLPGNHLEAMLLETGKELPVRRKGDEVVVDLSMIRPGEISPSGIFVIKFTSLLNGQ